LEWLKPTQSQIEQWNIVRLELGSQYNQEGIEGIEGIEESRRIRYKWQCGSYYQKKTIRDGKRSNYY